MFSFPVNLASGGADSSEEEEELPLHRYIRELQEEEAGSGDQGGESELL